MYQLIYMYMYIITLYTNSHCDKCSITLPVETWCWQWG